MPLQHQHFTFHYEKILLIAFFDVLFIGFPTLCHSKRHHFVTLSAQAALHDTLFVADYGVTPDTYENQTERLEAAIADCKRFNSKVLVFEKGRYDLWTEGATYKKFFITNTSSESECPSKIKTIGMFFEDMEGLTIEGNDATLMFHGKVIFLQCSNASIVTLP